MRRVPLPCSLSMRHISRCMHVVVRSHVNARSHSESSPMTRRYLATLGKVKPEDHLRGNQAKQAKQVKHLLACSLGTWFEIRGNDPSPAILVDVEGLGPADLRNN